MCLGGAAGIIAALGELQLKKVLEEKINLHDTCGVHNLHGLPGLLGGFAGGLAASLSTQAFNEDELKSIFLATEDGRTVTDQGLF